MFDKYYKIMHVPTGLFKEGGINGRFNKVGKLWRLQTLKSHLQQFRRYRSDGDLSSDLNKEYNTGDGYKLKFDIKDCVVVEFDLIPQNQKPLKDFVDNEVDKDYGR